MILDIKRGHNIQAFAGNDETSGKEIGQGIRGINLLRDADEEAVDDVEEEAVEVQHDEDGGLVDADARESENGAHVKGIKKVISIEGKEKVYACDQPDCTKTFTRASILKRHIKVVHKKERMHTCKQKGCLKKFGAKQNLDRHADAVHKKERPFKCSASGCTKKFGRKRTLDLHTANTHQGVGVGDKSFFSISIIFR